jgi:hypothetical protein
LTNGQAFRIFPQEIDICEWHPSEKREATVSDDFHGIADTIVYLQDDRREPLRVCKLCAQLRAFRYKTKISLQNYSIQ